MHGKQAAPQTMKDIDMIVNSDHKKLPADKHCPDQRKTKPISMATKKPPYTVLNDLIRQYADYSAIQAYFYECLRNVIALTNPASTNFQKSFIAG